MWIGQRLAFHPIDGQVGVGVGFLNAAARSGCGERLREGGERYQDRNIWEVDKL